MPLRSKGSKKVCDVSINSLRALKLRPDVTEPVLTRIDPFFSPRPWGTSCLAPLFPEKFNLQEPIGEAWLTALDSRVANGPFAGKSLGESWRAMPIHWKGTRNAAYPGF